MPRHSQSFGSPYDQAATTLPMIAAGHAGATVVEASSSRKAPAIYFEEVARESPQEFAPAFSL